MQHKDFSDTKLVPAANDEHAPQGEAGVGDPLPCGKAAGRPRAEDVEARTQNLIATASHLFVEKGYSKVSLEMIAREAHVAVRTIYVKFGGKAGLFNAVLASTRARYFSDIVAMDTDTRPMQQILLDFSLRFFDLVSRPASLRMQRMVIAEAKSSPELARTFFDGGPAHTRALLTRFFARPDIRAQLREDVQLDLLPVHLINCIMGDMFSMFLFEPESEPSPAQVRAALERRLALFFHGALRQP